MLPIRDIRLTIGELLAADVAFLAAAAANKIALITAAFNPGEDLVVADLTLATFTGGEPKGGVAGAQQAGVDPATSDQVITILAPVGGWRWECTVDPASPETVYGYALVDDAVAVLLGTELLQEPLVIQQAGEFIDIGSVTMTIVAEPIS